MAFPEEQRPNRLLAVLSGLAMAIGVAGLTVSMALWLSGGSVSAAPILTVGAAAFAFAFVLRRRLTSPTLRLSATAGAWTSLVTMSFCAAGSGYIDTRAAAYLTAMRSDLRNLVTAQNEFRTEHGVYADTIPPGFRNSTGVLPARIRLTADGWTASVTHSMNSVTCTIFVGRTPLSPAVEEQSPACTRLPFRVDDHFVPVCFLVAGLALAAFGRAVERDKAAGHA